MPEPAQFLFHGAVWIFPRRDNSLPLSDCHDSWSHHPRHSSLGEFPPVAIVKQVRTEEVRRSIKCRESILGDKGNGQVEQLAWHRNDRVRSYQAPPAGPSSREKAVVRAGHGAGYDGFVAQELRVLKKTSDHPFRQSQIMVNPEKEIRSLGGSLLPSGLVTFLAVFIKEYREGIFALR